MLLDKFPSHRQCSCAQNQALELYVQPYPPTCSQGAIPLQSFDGELANSIQDNEVPKATNNTGRPASGSKQEKTKAKEEMLHDLMGLLESDHDSELKIKKSTHHSEGRETSKLSAKITHSPQTPQSDKNNKEASAKPNNKSKKGSVSFDNSIPSEEEPESSSAVDSGKPKAQGKKSKDKGKGLATTPDTAPANHSAPAASGGQVWTASEDATILGMKEGGETWANIGNAVSRSKGEVQKRFKELMANKGDTAKDAAGPSGKGKGKMTTPESSAKGPEPEHSHDNHRAPPDQSHNNHRPPPDQSHNNRRPPPEQPNNHHRPPESFQGFPPPVNDYSHDRDYYLPAPYNYHHPPPPPAPYGYPYGPVPYHPRPDQYSHYHESPYGPTLYGNRFHRDGDVVYGTPRPNTRVNGGGPDLVWFADDGPAVKEKTINGIHNTWIRCYTGDEVEVNGNHLREPPNGWRNDRHKNASSPDGKRHVIQVKCNSGEGVWVMATHMDEPHNGWGDGGRGFRIMEIYGESTEDWDHSKGSRPSDGDRSKGNKHGAPNGDCGGGSNKPPSVNGGWDGASNKPPSDNGGWGGGSNNSNKPPSVNGGWGNGSNKAASIKDWVDASSKAASVKGDWGSGSNKGGSPVVNEWGSGNNGSNKGSGSATGWGDNNISGGGPSGATGGDWGDNSNGSGGPSGATGGEWDANNNNGGGNSGTNGGGWGDDNNNNGDTSGATGGVWGENNNNGGGNSPTKGNDWDTGNTNADNGPTQDDWGDGKNNDGGKSASNGSTWGNGDNNADNKDGQDDWGDTANNNKPDGSTSGKWDTDSTGVSLHVPGGWPSADRVKTGKYSWSDKRRQKGGAGRAPSNKRTNWKSDPKPWQHNVFDDGGSKNSKEDDNASQASWNMEFVVDHTLGSSNTGNKKNQVSPTTGRHNAGGPEKPGARKKLDEEMLKSYIQNWRGVDGTKSPKNDQGWDNNNDGNKDQNGTSSGNNGGATEWDNPGPSQQPTSGW